MLQGAFSQAVAHRTLQNLPGVPGGVKPFFDLGEERLLPKRAAFIGVAALLATSLTQAYGASAQTIPSPYRFIEERQEIGVFVGYFAAATGRFGYGPAGGPWLGGRYGVELTGPLSFEGVGGAVIGTRDIISPGRPEGDRKVGEADAIIGTIDLRLKLSATGTRAWHGLSPFIVLGAGIAFEPGGSSSTDALLEPDEVFDFGPTFFGTAGMGTRWFITPHFGVRADAVFSLWKLGTPAGFGDPQFGFAAVDEKEWVRGLSITSSFLFRW